MPKRVVVDRVQSLESPVSKVECGDNLVWSGHRFTCQIGDTPGNPQRSVRPTSSDDTFTQRPFHRRQRCTRESELLSQRRPWYLRVGPPPVLTPPLGCSVPSRRHARTNIAGAFPHFVDQRSGCYRLHPDPDVDSVQQRARQFPQVTATRRGCADAVRVSRRRAWARIRGQDQLEPRRVPSNSVPPGDSHFPVFEWCA